MDPPLVLGILDPEGQIVTTFTDPTVMATITMSASSITTQGDTSFAAEKGYFVLYPLDYSYKPNS